MTTRIDPAAISDAAGEVELGNVFRKPQKRTLEGEGGRPGYHTSMEPFETVPGLPKRFPVERRWIAVERGGEMRQVLVERQKRRKRR
jgi:hypothetical protein